MDQLNATALVVLTEQETGVVLFHSYESLKYNSKEALLIIIIFRILKEL